MSDHTETNTSRPILSPTAYDRTLHTKPLPTDDTDVWIGRWPNIPYLRVCWHTSARLRVLLHCYKTPNIEVGGVLLGGIYRTSEPGGAADMPMDFIEITGSIEAEYTDAGQGHLELTTETWARVNSIRDHDYPKSDIIGWYHTHPGHGVFLSGQDLFIHNNFFTQEFQLALVIDTHKHRGAFFVGSQKQLESFKSKEFSWDHKLLRGIRGIIRSGPSEVVEMCQSEIDTNTIALSPASTEQDVDFIISEIDLSPDWASQEELYSSREERRQGSSLLTLAKTYILYIIYIIMLLFIIGLMFWFRSNTKILLALIFIAVVAAIAALWLYWYHRQRRL